MKTWRAFFNLEETKPVTMELINQLRRDAEAALRKATMEYEGGFHEKETRQGRKLSPLTALRRIRSMAYDSRVSKESARATQQIWNIADEALEGER